MWWYSSAFNIKLLEVRQKYSAAERCIFNSLLSVWHLDKTLWLVWDSTSALLTFFKATSSFIDESWFSWMNTLLRRAALKCHEFVIYLVYNSFRLSSWKASTKNTLAVLERGLNSRQRKECWQTFNGASNMSRMLQTGWRISLCRTRYHWINGVFLLFSFIFPASL